MSTNELRELRELRKNLEENNKKEIKQFVKKLEEDNRKELDELRIKLKLEYEKKTKEMQEDFYKSVKEKTNNDPTISSNDNITKASALFIEIRDHSIASILDEIADSLNVVSNSQNKNQLRRIINTILFKDFWNEIEDISEIPNKHEKTLANKINLNLNNTFNKKINHTTETYKLLEAICLETIKLHMMLTKCNPYGYVYIPKINIEFDTVEHDIRKQDVTVIEVIKPGLKFGNMVYTKAIVKVELE